MLAADQGYTDIVKALLEKGADPKVKDQNGWTAAMRAFINEHYGILTTRQFLNN